MKTPARKIGRGQPLYDGLGADVSAVGLHLADLYTERQPDGVLSPDGWGYSDFNPPIDLALPLPGHHTATS